jgi:hypothetical protein
MCPSKLHIFANSFAFSSVPRIGVMRRFYCMCSICMYTLCDKLSLCVQDGLSTDSATAQSYKVPATFLGFSSVACQFQTFLNYSVEIAISLDGVNSSNALPYSVIDSQCNTCTDVTCTPRVSDLS